MRGRASLHLTQNGNYHCRTLEPKVTACEVRLDHAAAGIVVEKLQRNLEHRDTIGGNRKQRAPEIMDSTCALRINTAAAQITQKPSAASRHGQNPLSLRRLQRKHGRWVIPPLPDVQGCLNKHAIQAAYQKSSFRERITGAVDSQIRLDVHDGPLVDRVFPDEDEPQVLASRAAGPQPANLCRVVPRLDMRVLELQVVGRPDQEGSIHHLEGGYEF